MLRSKSMGIDTEKIAEYSAILVFGYLCLYVNIEVLKNNKSWLSGIFLSVLSPVVVFMLMSVVGWPISEELIITVASFNLVIAIFIILKQNE